MHACRTRGRHPVGYSAHARVTWDRSGTGPCACRRIHFETDLFVGCAVVWARGVPSAPARLFEGQRRRTVMAVQGRFKRPVAVEDLVTGQEFARPPKNLPAKWLVEKVLIRVRVCASPSSEPLHGCVLDAPPKAAQKPARQVARWWRGVPIRVRMCLLICPLHAVHRCCPKAWPLLLGVLCWLLQQGRAAKRIGRSACRSAAGQVQAPCCGRLAVSSMRRVRGW